MNNKNKFKTYFIAKRISKVLLTLSVVIVILALFMILYINTIHLWIGPRALIYNPSEIMEAFHFLNTIIPIMIISGILGLAIFSLPIWILSNYLKNHFPHYNHEFYKENNRFKEDIFRLY